MARQNPQSDQQQEFGSVQSAGQPPRRLPDRLSVRRLFLMLIEQMVRHRPLVFWSAVWMVPLLMAIVALTALMTPEYAAQKPITPTPPPLAPAPTATQPVQPVSITSTATLPASRRGEWSWSLGAIVFTCAAGSVLVSRRLNRAQVHPRLTPKELSRVVKRSHAPAKAPRGMPKRPRPQPAQPAAVLTQPELATPLPVSVVPSSESHPLDWDEDSLADLMDIRKRRSLSSWL